MMNINHIQKLYEAGQKISMVTCYDYTMAKILAETSVDCLLVGDSLAMVMHGYATTINATMPMMALHTQAVVQGANNKFIIADLPFLSYRKGLKKAMQAVEQLMQAGAHAVKLEGAEGNLEIIKHIVGSGVPVMGHLGLTPQSVHQLGGFRVQAKEEHAAKLLITHTEQLQEAGCFAIVLECIPSTLGKQITEKLCIPTIGIGAGPDVSGQVLVLQDLLGMDKQFRPKFLKQYSSGFQLIQDAINLYNQEVKQGYFPTAEHSY